jgi:hypothetical protein
MVSDILAGKSQVPDRVGWLRGLDWRVDLLVSVYLPYCRVFVTNDHDQEACLLEMAAVASLDTEVLSYDDFRNRLLTPSLHS